MKKCMMMLILSMLAVQLIGKEPVARITSDIVTVAIGGTNVVKDIWLNTGSDSTVITPTGTGRMGVGLVRSVLYSAPVGVANGTIAVYAYDAGVESAIYTGTGVVASASSRYDLTNNVYSGRLRVKINQTAYTNAACVWPVSAIVQ